ncbi:MAG: ECF transporter S component [Clostridia bacterium]|nr:ECF transporter S component [Clostridia bacterium]
MKNKQLKRLVFAALLLALGYILPFFTGQIPEIGSMLLPMHLPVLVCGIICGWQWGAAVGFVLPLTRSLMFGMPPIYPSALAMAFEMATYGLIIGLCYKLFPKKGLLTVYASLIIAMLAGRAVWGTVQCILLGLGDNSFTFAAFIAGAFVNAIPGIVLQLVLIPALIFVLQRYTKVIE